jgi:hypothetical protein
MRPSPLRRRCSSNEGHAPLLADRFSQRLIADFLADADKSWQAPKRSPMPKYTEVVEA